MYKKINNFHMINKDFKKLLIALKKNISKDLDIFFASIPNEILNNKEFIQYAIQITGTAYKYASQDIRKNKEILIQALKNDSWGTISEYIPDSLINDKDVKELVIRNLGSTKYLFEKFDINLEENQNFVIESLKKDVNRFNFIPDSLKNDRNFFIKAVKSNGRVMHFANDSFKDDSEIIEEAVKIDGNALFYATDRLQKNKSIAMTAVKSAATDNNGAYRIFNSIQYLRSDKDLIKEAIKYGNGKGVFEFIIDEYKDNIEFGIELLNLNPSLITDDKFINTYITQNKFVTYLLNNLDNLDIIIPQKIIAKNSNNKDLILSILDVIKKYPKHYLQKTFEYIDIKLKDDKDFFVKAVILNGLFLEFATSSIKNNYDVVLEAIKDNGISIYFANEELQKNESLINIAIANGAGTKILTKELSTKENLTIAFLNLKDINPNIITERHCSISNANTTLKDDRVFCLSAVKLDGANIQYISENLLKDIELVEEAFINSRGLNLFLFDHRLNTFNDNKGLVLKLIQTGAKPLEHISIKLQDDFDVVINAVSNHGSQLKFASEKLKDNQQIILKAIENDSKFFEFASNSIKSNVEFILYIIKNTKFYIRNKTNQKTINEHPSDYIFIPNLEYIFQFCSEQILSNKELMIEALKQDGNLLKFVSESLRSDKEIVLIALNSKPSNDLLKLASKKLQDDLDLLILTLK
jgi:hypothetical protein